MRPNGLRLYHGELSPSDWQFRVRALSSRHVMPLALTGTLDIEHPAAVARRTG